MRHKLPPRLLNQCLRDIFTYLLSESPTVVAIEQTHLGDLLSWDVIVNLINITSMAMLVIAMEPLQELILAKMAIVTETVRGMYGVKDLFIYLYIYLSIYLFVY